MAAELGGTLRGRAVPGHPRTRHRIRPAPPPAAASRPRSRVPGRAVSAAAPRTAGPGRPRTRPVGAAAGPGPARTSRRGRRRRLPAGREGRAVCGGGAACAPRPLSTFAPPAPSPRAQRRREGLEGAGLGAAGLGRTTWRLRAGTAGRCASSERPLPPAAATPPASASRASGPGSWEGPNLRRGPRGLAPGFRVRPRSPPRGPGPGRSCPWGRR